MPNWQLTATSIFCEDCAGEVTIIVYKDGQVKCTGVSGQALKNKKTVVPSCSAERCKHVAGYKAKLDSEERDA
jgi:hypothetical protein